MRSGAHVSALDIEAFAYALGDLTGSGARSRPPTVKQGGTLTFRNLDSRPGQDPRRAIYRTITGCPPPCNKAAGIAYPLADGKATFDSDELGYGPPQTTAAANRATWKTPKTPVSRHLQLLLPRAPVHARSVPSGQGLVSDLIPSSPTGWTSDVIRASVPRPMGRVT
jgi:hypothetical protein